MYLRPFPTVSLSPAADRVYSLAQFGYFSFLFVFFFILFFIFFHFVLGQKMLTPTPSQPKWSVTSMWNSISILLSCLFPRLSETNFFFPVCCRALAGGGGSSNRFVICCITLIRNKTYRPSRVVHIGTARGGKKEICWRWSKEVIATDRIGLDGLGMEVAGCIDPLDLSPVNDDQAEVPRGAKSTWPNRRKGRKTRTAAARSRQKTTCTTIPRRFSFFVVVQQRERERENRFEKRERFT